MKTNEQHNVSLVACLPVGRARGISGLASAEGPKRNLSLEC